LRGGWPAHAKGWSMSKAQKFQQKQAEQEKRQQQQMEEARRDEQYRKQMLDSYSKFINYVPVPWWGTERKDK
jgi:hypothetical protein